MPFGLDILGIDLKDKCLTWHWQFHKWAKKIELTCALSLRLSAACYMQLLVASSAGSISWKEHELKPSIDECLATAKATFRAWLGQTQFNCPATHNEWTWTGQPRSESLLQLAAIAYISCNYMPHVRSCKHCCSSQPASPSICSFNEAKWVYGLWAMPVHLFVIQARHGRGRWACTIVRQPTICSMTTWTDRPFILYVNDDAFPLAAPL